MKRTVAALCMGALLSVPAGAAATREAFKVRYGTNKSKRNAFGKCVSGEANARS